MPTKDESGPKTLGIGLEIIGFVLCLTGCLLFLLLIIGELGRIIDGSSPSGYAIISALETLRWASRIRALLLISGALVCCVGLWTRSKDEELDKKLIIGMISTMGMLSIISLTAFIIGMATDISGVLMTWVFLSASVLVLAPMALSNVGSLANARRGTIASWVAVVVLVLVFSGFSLMILNDSLELSTYVFFETIIVLSIIALILPLVIVRLILVKEKENDDFPGYWGGP